MSSFEVLAGVLQSHPIHASAALQACEQLFELAESGCVRSQFLSGVILTHVEYPHPNPSRALKFYEQAAQQGNIPAMYNAGILSMQPGPCQNFEKAMHWLHESAKQGIAAADNQLGLLYFQGLGSPVNIPLALTHFEKAAARGITEAHVNLGDIFHQGIPNVMEKNHARAYECYLTAANKGHVNAMFNVACLLQNGEGIEQSQALAAEWFLRAHQGGHPQARDTLKALGKGKHNTYAPKALMKIAFLD